MFVGVCLGVSWCVRLCVCTPPRPTNPTQKNKASRAARLAAAASTATSCSSCATPAPATAAARSLARSARSGENVLASFYAAAARFLGMTVTASELEALRKVIGVAVVRGDDEARTAEADRIEREDAEAERRKSAGGCCCVQ